MSRGNSTRRSRWWPGTTTPAPLRAAIIGTGPTPLRPSASGAGMGYHHAAGYRRLRGVDLVACVDQLPEHAQQFAAVVGVPSTGVFTSTDQMLRRAKPEIVSICVPPAAHADLGVKCARSPSVRAVHCEKPMATTWLDCIRMVEVCKAEGVQLTFNHQRRFSAVVSRTKQLLTAGAVGPLVRIELGSQNLFDSGTHWFDLCRYFTDGAPLEWVHADLDYDGENRKYGEPQETWALAQWRYRNGVTGLASTGTGSLLNCQLRLVGRDGTLEFGCDGGPSVRHKRHGEAKWTVPDTHPDAINGPARGRGVLTEVARRTGLLKPWTPTPRGLPATFVERAIASVVDSLESGEPSPLAGTAALASTELIFACWESARRGQRVVLPLDIDDNPLETMIADGRFGSVEVD